MIYTREKLQSALEKAQQHTAYDFMRSLAKSEPILADILTTFMTESVKDLSSKAANILRTTLAIAAEVLLTVQSEIKVESTELFRCKHCNETLDIPEASIHARFEDLSKIDGSDITLDEFRALEAARRQQQKGMETYTCEICITPYTDRDFLRRCLFKNTTKPLLVCAACFEEIKEKVEQIYED